MVILPLPLPLLRHPDSRCDAVERIAVDVARSGRWLALRYQIFGRIADLHLPTADEQRAPRALWQTSCCEAFVRCGEAAAYREWNLSPSGEWDCFAFRDYRQQEADPPETPPVPYVRANIAEDRFCLRATIALPGEGPWQIGLSAVIEERGGRLSYWALAHPPGKADFHHADCFACTLPASV